MSMASARAAEHPLLDLSAFSRERRWAAPSFSRQSAFRNGEARRAAARM